jgi:predicted RNA binding protein YcfA (HicA-like mRNA interferase family)
MKSLPAKTIMKILEEYGFFRSRMRGSHHIYTNNAGVMVPVPMHNKTKELPIGTFLAIVRQSKLDRKVFKK